MTQKPSTATNPSSLSGTPVVNQLHFRTNAHTIVPFLKTKAGGGSGHALFSLHSIVNLPKNLHIPLSENIIGLALLNIKLPILDPQLRARIVSGWAAAYSGQQAQAVIQAALDGLRVKLQGSAHAILEQAIDNYAASGYFCQYDWCMDHWGTPEDVQAVGAATFQLPTTSIEFTTLATPPVLALQQLANIFPSVLFTLRYRYPSEGTWSEVEFHPFPPFGY